MEETIVADAEFSCGLKPSGGSSRPDLHLQADPQSVDRL